MAIPLKAISIGFPGDGLIFEGWSHLSFRWNGKFCQDFCSATLKDQPAARSGEIPLRYRLSGNSHPGSAENLILTRVRRLNVKTFIYIDSQLVSKR